ncbi:type II secretion system F family protein [Aquifex aeolicus]|uniref:Fimbrial assembly protein PilC2 n=1 Tax=Aquifex aeolicus (strain VF5) TaxID=224324 RepID=O67317_AQUAE|nr:type II secretion system F family protein [Aquifex aeolicus]AAC07273.1 fimbrial assembly protein PilC2 [Aquifex aeolicus VF5]
MKEFVYEGYKEGRKLSGKVRARDEVEAFKKLISEGVKPISIHEEKKKLSFKFFKKRVGEEELGFSLIQLSLLLSSGIPLTRALELVSSQTENENLKNAFFQVKEYVEKGYSLAEAFKRTGVFPEFLTEMLTGVQRGENLEYVFQVAGEYLQKVAEFKNKVITSITYPAFVITFSFLSLFVAVKFVVPRIAKVLEGFGKELPLITKLVILFSDVLTLFLLLLPLILLIFQFREKIFSRERLDYLTLKIPVIGKLNLYFNLSRFSRTLSMLLEASVPLSTALSIAVKSVSNVYLRKKLESLVSEVEKGKSFSALLSRENVLPELFVNLVETGEVSGELEKTLNLLAQVYEKQSDRLISFWLRLVEPLAILVIGITVGIIAFSVILPLTEISMGFKS